MLPFPVTVSTRIVTLCRGYHGIPVNLATVNGNDILGSATTVDSCIPAPPEMYKTYLR